MKRIIFLSLFLLLISCGLILNKTNNFNIHKRKIFENKQSIIKTNGIYLSNEEGVLFYENGIFRKFSPTT